MKNLINYYKSFEYDGKVYILAEYFKSQNLEELRNIINQNIKDEFSLLDQDGFPITKKDEKLYTIEDILNDKLIKIKGNDSPVSTPLNETNPNKNIKKQPIKGAHKNESGLRNSILTER